MGLRFAQHSHDYLIRKDNSLLLPLMNPFVLKSGVSHATIARNFLSGTLPKEIGELKDIAGLVLCVRSLKAQSSRRCSITLRVQMRWGCRGVETLGQQIRKTQWPNSKRDRSVRNTGSQTAQDRFRKQTATRGDATNNLFLRVSGSSTNTFLFWDVVWFAVGFATHDLPVGLELTFLSGFGFAS